MKPPKKKSPRPKRPPVINSPGTWRGTTEVWFAFPDTHIPDHDEQALELALLAHQTIQPDHSLILGDFIDCGAFSRHPKKTIAEAVGYDFKERELQLANEVIDRIHKNTKDHLYYIEGNHESRPERWAVEQGPVAQSIYQMISPKLNLTGHRKTCTWIPYSRLDSERLGFVQIVPESKEMRSGGLVAVHGFSHAKNAAQAHLDKSKTQSILFGHVHRACLTVSRDPWSGRPIKAFCPGTLSKLQPSYAHAGDVTEWTHGFGIIYVGRSSWTQYLVSIENGACVLPDGRELKL